MKKIISLFMVLAMLTCTSAFALDYGTEWSGYTSVTTAKFNDISTHWAKDNINRAYDKGWIDGYPDGSFGPDNSINRGEALTIFMRFLGIQPEAPETNYYTYSKPADNAWMIPYVEPAKKLLPQYHDGPGTAALEDMPITREDVVYALVLALKYDDKVLYADQSVLNMFKDKNSISASLKPYVAVAVSNGLVSGYDDKTFGGTDPLTRAEFATLLAKGSTIGFGTGSGFNGIPDYIAEVSVIEVAMNTSGTVNMSIGDTIDLTATAKMSNGELSNYTNISAQSSAQCVKANGTTLKAMSVGSAQIRFLNDSFLSNTVINVVVSAPSSAPVFNSINYDDVTTGAVADITGRVSDASGAAMTLTMNGENVSLSSGSFNKRVELNEGSNTFTFILTNSYGVTTEKVVRIKRENASQPTAIITPEHQDDEEDVNNATVTGYEWSASSLDLTVGETSQIKLFKVMSDGSKGDCTSNVQLISSDENVFTVNSNGKISGVGEGKSKLSFSLSAVGASVSMPRPVTISVKPMASVLTLKALEWSEASINISSDEDTTIKLFGVYSDGSKKDLTTECEVYSDDEDIAVVSGTTVKGKSKGSTILWFGSIPSNNINLPAPCKVEVTE